MRVGAEGSPRAGGAAGFEGTFFFLPFFLSGCVFRNQPAAGRRVFLCFFYGGFLNAGRVLTPRFLLRMRGPNDRDSEGGGSVIPRLNGQATRLGNVGGNANGETDKG